MVICKKCKFLTWPGERCYNPKWITISYSSVSGRKNIDSRHAWVINSAKNCKEYKKRDHWWRRFLG